LLGRFVLVALKQHECAVVSSVKNSEGQIGINVPKTTPEQDKALVLEAFDTLFNKRDSWEAAGTEGKSPAKEEIVHSSCDSSTWRRSIFLKRMFLFYPNPVSLQDAPQ
jgi:hypothetical protein